MTSEATIDMYDQVALQFGTPTYIYFEDIIRKSWDGLTKALTGINYSVHFAVKANSNLTILKLFNSLGAGFDIVSEGELRRVLASGGKASDVVFSGVGKTNSEITFALLNGIKTLNVESVSELNRIQDIVATLSKKAPILIRLNPNISTGAHEHISTGTYDSKFGIPIDDLGEVLTLISSLSNLELCGVACHIGSEVTKIDTHKASYESLISAAKECNQRGFNVKYVDFGGGLHIPYSGKYTPLDLNSYGEMLREVTKGLSYEFLFEPGKFLIAEAGVLLTRVIVRKKNGTNKFLVVDAGLSELVRPALYTAYHKVEAISNLDRPKETVDIVGPVCESACFIGKGRELPEVREGELLIVKDVGAYGFTMSSNYNSRPRSAEVLVRSDGKIELIRRREIFEELLRWE